MAHKLVPLPYLPSFPTCISTSTSLFFHLYLLSHNSHPQVLDALSYLHWRGYSHLDLQPDNIVLTSTRRCDVKLVDFGSAQQVSKAGSHINLVGHLEYMGEWRGKRELVVRYGDGEDWTSGVLSSLLIHICVVVAFFNHFGNGHWANSAPVLSSSVYPSR